MISRRSFICFIAGLPFLGRILCPPFVVRKGQRIFLTRQWYREVIVEGGGEVCGCFEGCVIERLTIKDGASFSADGGVAIPLKLGA